MYDNDCGCDDEIVKEMGSTQNNMHYRRYIFDRFIFDTDKDQIICEDKETGEQYVIEDGDELADGKVEFREKGVIFIPKRAEIEPFGLQTKAEKSPMTDHFTMRKRHHIDEVLAQEHRKALQRFDDDHVIIMLSAGEIK